MLSTGVCHIQRAAPAKSHTACIHRHASPSLPLPFSGRLQFSASKPHACPPRAVHAHAAQVEATPIAFSNAAAEDEPSDSFKLFNTAMYRWHQTDLREYEYAGKQGKDALIAAVDEINRFADSDLLLLKSSINSEMGVLFDDAERKLKDVKKIVNGVRSASIAANTVVAGAAVASFIPVFGVAGLAVSAGTSLANIIQQAATTPEVQRRLRELNASIAALEQMNVEAMSEVDAFKNALLSLTGNTESASSSVREGAEGFAMAVQLARVADTPSFEQFMDDIVSEYIEVSRDFDGKLVELQEMEVEDPELDIRPLMLDALNIGGISASAVSLTAVSIAFYLQKMLLRLPPTAPVVPTTPPDLSNQPYSTKRVIRNLTGYNQGLNKPAPGRGLSASQLKSSLRGLAAFAAAASLVAIGFDIAALVEAVKEFEKLEKDIKEGRAAASAVVTEIVSELEIVQEEFSVDVAAEQAAE